MEWIARNEPPVLINPLPAFASHPERDQMFLKTDTHWSYHAGLVVLGLVLQAMGFERELSLAGREIRHYRHIWDLGSKLADPLDEENIYVVPRPEVRQVYANAVAEAFEPRLNQGKSVFHASINVVFHNDLPDAIDETVVIFGDSFFEFRASSPTFLFAETFREVHFIWSANIDYSYIARANATLVITELAERFMIQVPTDQYDVEAEAKARMDDYEAQEH